MKHLLNFHPMRWEPNLLDLIVHATLRLACWVLGHDDEDQGWGSPESGCIDIVCARCGRSFGRTWLY